jgi:hypothetical protein
MVVDFARGVFATSRKAAGLSVATASDGSKGMRCDLVTCHVVYANEANNGTGPRRMCES